MNTLNRKYTAEEQLNIYSSLLDYTKQRLESEDIDTNDIYSGVYSFGAADKFSEAYKKVSQISKALKSGIKGETLAFNSLRILDYNVRVIKTVQTPSYNPQLSVEHDIIAITNNAIFTIEVKNINDPKVIITPQGVMVKESSKGEVRVGKNVAQQSRWHQTSLIKLLQGTKFENVRVVPVLMFSNDMCTFENQFSGEDNIMGFRCCYRATADEILFDPTYTAGLSSDDMAEIEQIILSADSVYEQRKYELCIAVEEYTQILEAFIKEVIEERKSRKKHCEYGVDEIRMYLNSLLVLNNTSNKR